jgi:cardiolipin synthase A/B
MDAELTRPDVPAPPPSPIETTPSQHIEAAGHEWTIFVESALLIRAMVRDIQSAQQRVWVEIYIFEDDALGVAIAEALKERARSGLDVRVLYDAIGSQRASAAFFCDMEQAGVQVHAFHTFWEALWRLHIFQVLNRRNHRKLMVIDDCIAYFGGMNLFDQSSAVGVEHSGAFPGSIGWRDVHVRLSGPQQSEVADSFEHSWRRAHRQRVKRRPADYRKAKLASLGEEYIQFFDSGPGRTHTRAARVFAQLFGVARLNILMSMAYFLPVGTVLRDLLRAHRRGVWIRVVVPGESDVPLVQCATRHLYGQLLRRRFHIYERQVHMLHSKVMVVDDEWTLLGSSNLDSRSLWLNLEFLAVVRSRALAQAMKRIILYEIECGRRIHIREYVQRCWWRWLIDRMAWSFRWWL